MLFSFEGEYLNNNCSPFKLFNKINISLYLTHKLSILKKPFLL